MSVSKSNEEPPSLAEQCMFLIDRMDSIQSDSSSGTSEDSAVTPSPAFVGLPKPTFFINRTDQGRKEQTKTSSKIMSGRNSKDHDSSNFTFVSTSPNLSTNKGKKALNYSNTRAAYHAKKSN